jgi:hypothetical protein
LTSRVIANARQHDQPGGGRTRHAQRLLGDKAALASMTREQANLMVDLGVSASGIAFPVDHLSKWRRRKTP